MKNFVKINRLILQRLGYRNTWQKSTDSNGKIKMVDKRNDFTTFTVFLRKHPEQFIEQTHYIIEACLHSRGQKRKNVYVRKDVLEKLLQNAFYKQTRKQAQVQHGVVYFIHEKDKFDRFKIGFSTDLKKRLSELQVGNPDLLVVYKTINASESVEHELHDYFASYHIRGEWFSVTPDMINCICKKYIYVTI